VDTAALADWVRAAMDDAARPQKQADVLVTRAAELRRKLGLRPTTHDHARLRRRLTAAETRAANLDKALASNRWIGMAIGILMARHGLTEDQAFAALRRQSSRGNVRLLTLAERVLYAGELEPAHPSSTPKSRARRGAGGVS
jgi:hypothetical protein